MTEKLKKCPICGKIDTLFVGTSKEIEEKKEDEYSSGYFAVCCNFQHGGCGTTGGYRATEEEATTLWNTRAEDENPLTLNELLKMDGQPIYINSGIDEKNHIYKREGWQIAGGLSKYSEHFFVTYENAQFPISNYGKTWLAYRRKSEGEIYVQKNRKN